MRVVGHRLLEVIAARYLADSLFRTPALVGSLGLFPSFLCRNILYINIYIYIISIYKNTAK